MLTCAPHNHHHIHQPSSHSCPNARHRGTRQAHYYAKRFRPTHMQLGGLRTTPQTHHARAKATATDPSRPWAGSRALPCFPAPKSPFARKAQHMRTCRHCHKPVQEHAAASNPPHTAQAPGAMPCVSGSRATQLMHTAHSSSCWGSQLLASSSSQDNKQCNEKHVVKTHNTSDRRTPGFCAQDTGKPWL
jgi:hypothetical protein